MNSCITLKQRLTEVTNVSQTSDRWFREVLALQRRLVYYGQQCDVAVTAHRLRHTFASQMLTAGMPVTSLQRFLGHEHLDTTMVYAEIADPKLQQDYYQDILSLDPVSETMGYQRLGVSDQDTLWLLV